MIVIAVRVGMVSLGCPKNQMDAELMLASLRDAGFVLVADAALADVVIINTCGFIEAAKAESIEQILEFAKLKEEGRVKRLVVTGCMAERYREELVRELPECDAILGLGGGGDIVGGVRAVLGGERVSRFPGTGADAWRLDGARVRTTPPFYAYLRVGDGCDNRCTYCAIPGIRGPLRSRDAAVIIQEARELAANGAKELILVAQDVTAYGLDRGETDALPALLDALCEIEDIAWLRLLYCYPQRLSDALLDVIARQPKIVKYLDIPLQHCDGGVLRAMGRSGDEEVLRALLARVRARVPDVTLRTTLLVGFPGETEEQFEQLCAFARDMRFERLGCFAYSAEEGTPAALLPAQVPEEEKRRRADVLMETQARVVAELQEAQVGRTLTVLVEAYDRYAEQWFGRTSADAPDIDGKVFFSADKKIMPGDMVQVRITDTLDWDLIGECRS